MASDSIPTMTCWCGEKEFSADKHYRRGEKPCAGSRRVHNDYFRNYYRNHSEKLSARQRELRSGRAYLIPEDDAL